MGNDVQLHESVVERAPGEERRASPRHDAAALGTVNARIIGGSPVELVNFSARGVLFECDSRLLIGARASVRITTTDANLIVTGRVVRSRVKGLVNGALRYDAALALDSELALQSAVPASAPAPAVEAPAAVPEPEDAPVDVAFESDDVAFESEAGIDGVFDPAPVEAYLAESDAALAEVARVVEPPPMPVASQPEPPSDALPSDPLQLEPLHLESSSEEPLTGEPMETEASFEPDTAEAVAVDVEAEAISLAADAEATELAAEPPAFEADGGEIAFEPVGDFEFEAMPLDAVFEADAGEMLEAPTLASTSPIDDRPDDEPAVAPERSSMFEATYRPHVEAVPIANESMFHATPPTSVHASTVTSLFDSRPSENYGETTPADAAAIEVMDAVEAVEPSLAPAIEADAEAEAIDFETEVAFEPADVVMFEAAFEGDSLAVDDVEPAAAAAPIEAVDILEPAPEVADEIAGAGATEPVEEIEPVEDGLDALADLPVPAGADDDRVLLQFSATVPHDLAELRRIAADNQW